MRRFRHLLIALVLSAFAAAPAFAASEYHGLGDEVLGRPGLTYADLLGRALGTVTAQSGGWRLELKRDLRDVDPDNDPETLPTEIAPTGVEAEALPGDGRMMVLVDSGDFFAILAIFDLNRDRPLVDAVAVTYDRLNSFGSLLDIGGGAVAVRVVSSHSNSGQAYAIDSLIMLDGDHLSLIDSILTLSDMRCGYRREQASEFAAVAAPSRAHADIAAAVAETVTATGEACDGSSEAPPPSTRRVAVTYRWDDEASEYVADSDALDRLQRETEERF